VIALIYFRYRMRHLDGPVRIVTVWHEPDHYWRADLDDIGTVLVGKPPGVITARGEPAYAVPEASALRAAQSMSQHLGVAMDGEQAQADGTTTYSAHAEAGATYRITSLTDSGFVIGVESQGGRIAIEPLELLTDQEFDPHVFEASW
jgi:hypothetical protein